MRLVAFACYPRYNAQDPPPFIITTGRGTWHKVCTFLPICACMQKCLPCKKVATGANARSSDRSKQMRPKSGGIGGQPTLYRADALPYVSVQFFPLEVATYQNVVRPFRRLAAARQQYVHAHTNACQRILALPRAHTVRGSANMCTSMRTCIFMRTCTRARTRIGP